MMYCRPPSDRGLPFLFYDATKPLNRCLDGERSFLPYLSSIQVELYYWTGIRANTLAGHDLDALAIDGHG